MTHDDGYQGIQNIKLTPREEEIAGLSDQITRLDETAQNAEDRDQLKKATATRAKIKPLQDRLDVLTGKRAIKASDRASDTWTDDELAAVARARGEVRGHELLTLPGMDHQLAMIRAGRGYGGTAGIVEGVWNDAGLHRPEVCSDERAVALDARLTAAVDEGVLKAVGQ